MRVQKTKLEQTLEKVMSLLLRGTLSSVMNLDDTDNFGDHFLKDNPTKYDQANTSAHLLSTTTTLALPPPPPTQSSTDPELVATVAALERRNAELEHAFTIQHKTTKNLASRIFTLEHHDIQAKIDNYVCEKVKENVHIALPLKICSDAGNDKNILLSWIIEPRFEKYITTIKFIFLSKPPAHTSSWLHGSDPRKGHESAEDQAGTNPRKSHEPLAKRDTVSDLEDTENANLPKITTRADLNHLSKRVEDLQLGIESYQTKLNLEQPNWDASDFLFKEMIEDYTVA
ncbi:hypothetical protein Tco_1532297 [Tanacetum coccineum]